MPGRPLWLAALLLALSLPAAYAQTAERSELQQALDAIERGTTLTPAQKMLLGESGYTPPEPMDVLEVGGYTLGYRTNQSAAMPSSLINLFTEDFSAGIPATWSTSRSGAGTNAWAALTNPGYGGSANPYVGWNDDAAGSGSFDQNLTLATPDFSTTGNATVYVIFDYSYRRLGTTERYALEFSTDGGATWQTGVADLPTTAASAASLYPQSINYVATLPAAAGNQPSLRLRWRYDDGSAATAGYNWYGSLDNVRVSTTNTVAAPQCATLVSPSNGATGVEGLPNFQWAPGAGDSPTGYRLGISTGAPPTTFQLFTGTSVVLSGTTPGTTYFWQVIPTNAGGDATGCPVWSFTTKPLGLVSSFPYTETFDTTTNTGPPATSGSIAGAGIAAGWYNSAGQNQDFWRTVASADAEPVSGATTDHTSGTGRFAYVNDSDAAQTTATNGPRWLTPRFDITGLNAPRLKFWYQNVANGNTTVTALSTLDVLVSTDGGVTFATTPALTINTRVNTWTEYTVSLASFVSAQTVVAFRVAENSTGTTSDPSLDDVRVEATPTNPVFALSPNTPTDFGAAGACAGTTSVQRTFTVTNAGAGSLTVTGATVTGSSAFAVTAGTFPATLTAGQSAPFTVTFQPTAAQSGAQTATLTVSYNDGTAQSATVALSATVDPSNVSGGTGAGITFASSATGACAPTGPAPAGTAFIDIATHTQITTWTDDGATGGDDSYFTIPAAALDGLISGGQIRFLGRNYETLFVNSNGYVGFGAPTGNLISSLPTTTGGGVVAAFAQDYDVTSSVYDTADPGQYPVGVYYGSSDVDGDSRQDLVVTWFHAYDYLSPAYTSATTRYATFQLVVFRGARANEDDRFEVRLIDGVDGAGVPYRLNTATQGSPTIEADGSIGISANSTAAGASSEYRDDTVGGPVYAAGGGSLAVRFTPETQATAADDDGWRMMGAPVSDFTVARLADLNLVQGVTNQYPAVGVNLYTGYSGTAFTPATSTANALTPGRGFLWYLYDIDCNPPVNACDGSGPNTTGTSQSYTLPMALQGTGAELSTATVSVPLSSAGNGFNLVANPFRASLNTSGLASWANGTLASSAGQIWDPADETYTLTTELGNVVSAWQGLFIQNATTGGATTLAIPATARTTGGTFVGREGAAGEAFVAFRLAGTTPDGAPTLDRAAVLAFAEDATPEWDLLDASKLTPLAPAYATAAFVGQRDGETEAQAQFSLPSAPGQFTVPVVIDAVGTSPTLTLSWPTLQNVPETWSFSLRDLQTGAIVDLRQATSYSFSVAPEAARTGGPDTWLDETTTAAQAAARRAARFELVVAIGNVVSTGVELPTVFALDAVRPNPTSGAASVRFALPDAATVSVTVYDLLGRQVAVLAEGARAAGWHTADLGAARLSAGSYLVRMQAGTFTATQRVTVVR